MTRVMKRNTAEMGREKKIEIVPLEIRRDSLRLLSTMGPHTRARRKGEPSKSNFLIR